MNTLAKTLINKPPIVSLKDLTSRITEDTVFADDFRNNPVEVLGRVTQEAELYKPTADKVIYRGVVLGLGILAIASLSMIFALAYVNPDITIPQGLVALGSAAVGALAGFLVPAPQKS